MAFRGGLVRNVISICQAFGNYIPNFEDISAYCTHPKKRWIIWLKFEGMTTKGGKKASVYPPWN